MIRRILLALVLLVLVVVALPPLVFAVFPEAPAELPPAGRRVVLPGGVGVNVLEAGSGPPVVLVHGLPGSGYDWRALTGVLAARGRRALAYDRLGYARSDAPSDGDYTMERNAADLVQLLATEGLQHATVVGWSYGGSTAILAARQDPSRMGALVLVGSAGPGIERSGPPPAMALAMSGPVLAWLRAVPPLARALRATVSTVAFSDQAQPDWWLPTLDANFAQPNTSRTYAEEGRALVGAPPDPAGIALPVVVIHGADDRLCPIAIGRELARRAPGAKLVEVPGGSHMLPVTHAGLVADEIVAIGTR